jgi:diadenosine tetraphosphate (Ap4A) HIT family hydrolase
MTALEDHYPQDCPFCAIAKAYPAEASPIPRDPDPDKVSPQCHLLLSTPHVIALLDILPIAPGHILVCSRDHYRKVADLYAPAKTADWASQRAAATARETSRAIGEWLPIVSAALCKVTGIEDWNIVQNNGARAAQVVPHVHFHLIPRYQEGRRDAVRKGKVDVGMLKSWTMFGRGAREDLDDEEGKALAAELRKALRKEILPIDSEGGKTKL